MKKIFVKNYYKILYSKEHYKTLSEVFVTGYYDETKNTVKIIESMQKYIDGKNEDELLFSHTFTLEGLNDYIAHNGFFGSDHREAYTYARTYLERHKDDVTN